MEYYDFCSKVIEKELKKFKLDPIAHSEFEYGLTALFPEDFDVPYNRCAFMSCYATSNIITFKDCISNFLLSYPKAQDLLCEWKSHFKVKVCSLSTGPGLDYLAFMLAILEYDPIPPQLDEAKIVSKYSSWQSTIDLISEVIHEQGSVHDGISLDKLNFDKVKVIQTDDLLKCFSKTGEHGPLRDAHIVLMMKTLNLSAPGLLQETSILQMLKELLSSLRSDATIFCFDTIPSITLFTRALSSFPGQLLYGPTQQTSTIPPIHPECDESQPLVHSKGTFFVWRKLPFSFRLDLFPFKVAPVKTDLRNDKLVTTLGGRKHVLFVSDSLVDKPLETCSEILPWRELPPSKLCWGTIFWENLSPISKKSLKSLMTLKKESLERHWIEEVARLYLKEYGTQNSYTSPSENIVAGNNSGESTLRAKQVEAAKIIFNAQSLEALQNVNNPEILFNAQIMEVSQNVNCSKDIDVNTESVFTVKLLSGNVNEEKASVSTDGVTETFEKSTNPEALTSMNIHKEVIDSNIENISFQEENVTCQKTNAKTQFESITKELSNTTKLTAVVSNNIKEGSQYNNKLFETDIQISLQNKNNPTTTQISDIREPPCSKSSSKIKKQKEQLKYSEILPWRELPPGKIAWGAIFWQNASVTTKKSLKSVLSFKKDILDHHWIGEVARLYIKEYGTQNMSTSLLREVRNKGSTSIEKVVERTHISTKASDMSIPKTMLTPLSTYTIPKNKLNNNTENTLFEKGKCFDVPNSLYMEASSITYKSMQHDFSAQTDGVVYQSLGIENIAVPLQFKENLAKNQTIKSEMNDTEPSIDINTADKTILSQTTVNPDINQTKNNLSSMEALFESIRQLETMLERLIHQNDTNTMKETCRHAHQKPSASHNNPNTYGKGESINSIHSTANHASASRDRSSFQNEDIHMKWPHRCNSFHSTVKCCSNRTNNMTPLHSCSLHCHSHNCSAPRCQFSLCGHLTCSENHRCVNSTSQNLVIPIRNISDDALLKIVSILKRG